MAGFDLLVLGDVNPDIVVSGGDVEPAFGQAERLVHDVRLTVGGSGAIVACGAARLGLRVAFAGVVGADRLGDFMRDELVSRGVDVRGLVTDARRPTGGTVVLTRGDDRAILTAPGTIATLRADLVAADLLGAARHIHVSSYFLQRALASDLADVLATARAQGGTTSLDPNWDPAGRWDGGLRSILSRLDVLFVNEAEALAIARATAVRQAASALRAAGVGCVVVKRGSAGALAMDQDEEVSRPSYVVDVVDSTGAGDCFDAGFLAASLNGDPLTARVALGNACGALSTRAIGGTDAQPTLGEAQAFIANSKAT
jgi:sugar/nucleoside kinase (ribokinase family)